jgi:hypothetical protein
MRRLQLRCLLSRFSKNSTRRLLSTTNVSVLRIVSLILVVHWTTRLTIMYLCAYRYNINVFVFIGIPEEKRSLDFIGFETEYPPHMLCCLRGRG